jgi:hypothetical protein
LLVDLSNLSAINIQPIHVVAAIFIALMLCAFFSLFQIPGQRRGTIITRIVSRVLMFAGSLVLGAFILSGTLGEGALPAELDGITSFISQALPSGNPLEGITQNILPGSGVGAKPQNFDTDPSRIFNEVSSKLAQISGRN